MWFVSEIMPASWREVWFLRYQRNCRWKLAYLQPWAISRCYWGNYWDWSCVSLCAGSPDPEPWKHHCIDIFSISLKSLNPEFYKQHTGAQLEPIPERINSSDKHLELSQLLVTGLNDSMQDIEQTIQWVLDTLGEKVPLHFVGLHPAYWYMEA